MKQQTNKQLAEKIINLFSGANHTGKVYETELKALLSSQLQQLKEKVGAEKGSKDHVCRFNDGEQNCECYNQALDQVLSIISEMEES